MGAVIELIGPFMLLEDGIGAGWREAEEPSTIELCAMLGVVVIQFETPEDTTLEVRENLWENAGGKSKGI